MAIAMDDIALGLVLHRAAQMRAHRVKRDPGVVLVMDQHRRARPELEHQNTARRQRVRVLERHLGHRRQGHGLLGRRG